ncbi:MAG: WD40 repeat domain-containing protein, partial [Maioricimonas sp. JB049]
MLLLLPLLIVICRLLAPLAPASAAEYRSLPLNPQHACSHLAFSPDGRFLAGAGYTHRQNRGQVTVWNLPSGEVSLTQLFPKYCLSPHFSPDSSLLAFASADQNVYVIRHEIEKRRTRWRLVARLPGPRILRSENIWPLAAHVRFSPDGKRLFRATLEVAPASRSSTGRPSATPGGMASRIELWPTNNFAVPDRVLHSAGGRVYQLAFLGKGSDTLLASVVARRGTIRLRAIDLEEDTITGDIAHHQITDEPGRYGFSFDVSPRDQQIALGGRGFLVLLDPRSFQITHRFTGLGEDF